MVVTYGVLGVGSIATSLVIGLSEGNAPPAIVLSPRNAERSVALAERYETVEVAADNQAVVDRCDVVVVCLRPEHVDTALADLSFRPGQALVSAVAGVPLERLRLLVAPLSDVARSVPLPAVAARDSVTPVHPASSSAAALYEMLGGAMAIDNERAFEALSVGSATVAAYFDYLGAVAAWLAEQGVAAPEARRYVADMFAALSTELRSEGADFGDLASAHSTAGGLNERFAAHMRAEGVPDAVRAGLDVLLKTVAPH